MSRRKFKRGISLVYHGCYRSNHGINIYIYILHTSPLIVHFPMTRSMRYQPILHPILHANTEHAYCLCYYFLNNVAITAVIEMAEMVEILNGRLGKRSVRYVINNLLHLIIVKYGVISLVINDNPSQPCYNYYIYHTKSRLNTPVWGSLCSPN